MNMRKSLSGAAVCVAGIMLAGSAGLWAQNTAVRARVVEAVDDTRTVRLQGNVHPLARPAHDQGALADSQPMTRMLLLLQRSQEQELALRQLMDAQLTTGSGSYHAWLTPEQFGKQFGPSDADVQAVTDWLTRAGFRVKKVAAGRTVVEFDGNAGQVRNAFHTEIHRFVVNGEEHFANVSDPAIPEALSPVVAGVVALHNFPKHPHLYPV
ncbi:MAG TPA: protease pro-enzyme activation domain-containing protein, partial [Candidatus Sulfotelmatobacter sp.]|nr:protease pro-enzyme activation domain-containing protein [Candidatus Sulfotelmatobacter sp.]